MALALEVIAFSIALLPAMLLFWKLIEENSLRANKNFRNVERRMENLSIYLENLEADSKTVRAILHRKIGRDELDSKILHVFASEVKKKEEMRHKAKILIKTKV